MPEFHAEAPQAIVSEGLAQGPYMAAKRRRLYQCAPHALQFRFTGEERPWH